MVTRRPPKPTVTLIIPTTDVKHLVNQLDKFKELGRMIKDPTYKPNGPRPLDFFRLVNALKIDFVKIDAL